MCCLSSTALLSVIIPDGHKATSTWVGAGIHLPQGQKQVVIAEQMRDGIIAEDHHIELSLVMGMERSHIANGEVDLDRTGLRLKLGPNDSPSGQVRGSYRETTLGQSDGLGADTARDIKDGFRAGSPALGDNA
jgi:hypothetical protein